MGAWIEGSGRGKGGLGGSIEGSGHDSGGLGGGIVASGRDSSTAGGTVASGRDSRRVSARIDGSKRDSSKVGGGIEGFGCVHAVARFLEGTLGCNSCKAFLFVFDLPWQAIQVLKTLLPRSAEALARKEESGSFWIQAEQYFEAIPDVKIKEIAALQVQTRLGC